MSNWTAGAIVKTDPLYEKKLEMSVERLFSETLFKFMTRNNAERVPAVHVSDLVYACPRKAYYAHTTPPALNMKSAITLWTGIMLHETPLTENCEMTLDWEGIVGTIDEYDADAKMLIDKKTTRNVPQYYNRSRKEQVVSLRSSHLTQLEYYKVLLEENGYPVEEAGIIYIDVAESKMAFGRAKFKRSNEVVKEEMLARKDILEYALNNRELPHYDNSVKWFCMGYCAHQQACALNVNPPDIYTEDYTEKRWSVLHQALEDVAIPLDS
jgi:CRISPR/Cas system-associated exonuclease Cas4 (RecB family)